MKTRNILNTAIIASFLTAGSVYADGVLDALKPGDESARATISDIKKNPQNFDRKTVRVQGQVDDIFGDRAFKLENDKMIDDELFVVTKKPIREVTGEKFTLAEDAKVELRGEIRQFNRADLEKELSWKMTPEMAKDFEGVKTALILDEVHPVTDQKAGKVAE